jgi:hypothetical protein
MELRLHTKRDRFVEMGKFQVKPFLIAKMSFANESSTGETLETIIATLSTIFNLLLVYFILFKSPKELLDYRLFLLQITVNSFFNTK